MDPEQGLCNKCFFLKKKVKKGLWFERETRIRKTRFRLSSRLEGREPVGGVRGTSISIQ